MNLQSDFADAELRRGLFVQEAAHHERQDLSFTRRQGRPSLLQRGQLASQQSSLPVLRKRRVDRAQQICLAEWLREKVHRSGLERAHGTRHVTMPRDEDNLWMRLADQLALKIEAVDVRKVDIQDEAARQVGLCKLQVLRGRPEGDDIQMCRGQQLL